MFFAFFTLILTGVEWRFQSLHDVCDKYKYILKYLLNTRIFLYFIFYIHIKILNVYIISHKSKLFGTLTNFKSLEGLLE